MPPPEIYPLPAISIATCPDIGCAAQVRLTYDEVQSQKQRQLHSAKSEGRPGHTTEQPYDVLASTKLQACIGCSTKDLRRNEQEARPSWTHTVFMHRSLIITSLWLQINAAPADIVSFFTQYCVWASCKGGKLPPHIVGHMLLLADAVRIYVFPSKRTSCGSTSHCIGAKSCMYVRHARY